MLCKFQIDLQEASADWIATRREWMISSGPEVIDAFSKSTSCLYVAFVEGIADTVSPDVIAEAFFAYRKMLIEWQDAEPETQVEVDYHGVPLFLFRRG